MYTMSNMRLQVHMLSPLHRTKRDREKMTVLSIVGVGYYNGTAVAYADRPRAFCTPLTVSSLGEERERELSE